MRITNRTKRVQVIDGIEIQPGATWEPNTIDSMGKPALLAELERLEVDHDRRWGVERLRDALTDAVG